MKKFGFICAAVFAALMSSCGNGTPTADMKSDLDSLSYAVGMAQTQGLKEYLVQRMGVDTVYINEFIKGLNEGATLTFTGLLIFASIIDFAFSG